jgi:chloramphenicol-sensitive protein RarD
VSTVLESLPAAGAPEGAAAEQSRRSARAGVLYAVAAYGAWGVFPVYFKAVRHVPALEVLAHRVLWSVAFLLVLLALGRNWAALAAALRRRRTMARLGVTTGLIAGNWLLFIWAVAHDHLLEASLGYFINPLLNVVLGMVFLRERLNRRQAASVLLAAAGVTYLTLALRAVPAIALLLALSFGLYGLLRKTAAVDPLIGLTVETALLAPAAAVWLVVQMVAGRAVFGSAGPGMNLLLLSAGVLTATPLLWFAAAARRLRFATLGFLQYLSPTGQFLLAVGLYGEPFTRPHALAFGLIWTGLAVYSADALHRARPRGLEPLAD